MSFDRPRSSDRDDRPPRAMTTPEDVKPSAEEEALEDLRNEFPGHRIWRSPRWDGGLGSWVATLHDPRQGVDPTVIRDTAAELRTTLLKEKRRAEAKGQEWSRDLPRR
ncbi:hypothetical protein [Actinomadura kijaniata]|uniref:hypothetical protein n=1 Tax=Actinomadura kijaniata TaxID=46161 RepID=UPI00082B65D4|nr:hypothetical protein [Actinomadura kijaniata]